MLPKCAKHFTETSKNLTESSSFEVNLMHFFIVSRSGSGTEFSAISEISMELNLNKMSQIICVNAVINAHASINVHAPAL